MSETTPDFSSPAFRLNFSHSQTLLLELGILRELGPADTFSARVNRRMRKLFEGHKPFQLREVPDPGLSLTTESIQHYMTLTPQEAGSYTSKFLSTRVGRPDSPIKYEELPEADIAEKVVIWIQGLVLDYLQQEMGQNYFIPIYAKKIYRMFSEPETYDEAELDTLFTMMSERSEEILNQVPVLNAAAKTLRQRMDEIETNGQHPLEAGVFTFNYERLFRHLKDARTYIVEALDYLAQIHHLLDEPKREWLIQFYNRATQSFESRSSS